MCITVNHVLLLLVKHDHINKAQASRVKCYIEIGNIWTKVAFFKNLKINPLKTF